MENDNIYFDKEKTKGRPRLVLNKHGKELIFKLSKIMCTDEEMAGILGVTIETLQAKHNIDAFFENKKSGQSDAKSSLRKWQFETAEKGNATMQIWLGKQYLGQIDKKAEVQSWNGDVSNDS